LQNYIDIFKDELDIRKLIKLVTSKYLSINEGQEKLGTLKYIEKHSLISNSTYIRKLRNK